MKLLVASILILILATVSAGAMGQLQQDAEPARDDSTCLTHQIEELHLAGSANTTEQAQLHLLRAQSYEKLSNLWQRC